MRKTSKAMLICVAMIVMASAFLWGAAQKSDLVPCPINYPVGSTVPPGGGFVIFNNPADAEHNLEMVVSMKGAEPNKAYDIYLFVDQGINGKKLGTITTNRQGNANFHTQGLLEKGTHVLALDITLKGSGADVYETSGIHAVPMEGVSMTFK